MRICHGFCPLLAGNARSRTVSQGWLFTGFYECPWGELEPRLVGALITPRPSPARPRLPFRIRPRVFSGRSWPIAGSTFKFTCFLRETAGTCPRSLSWDVDGANVHGAWVWTLSRNFTGMPMSAGEWHAWPAAPKVETRGKAWQRDG
jgi:hypothetical protein